MPPRLISVPDRNNKKEPHIISVKQISSIAEDSDGAIVLTPRDTYFTPLSKGEVLELLKD